MAIPYRLRCSRHAVRLLLSFIVCLGVVVPMARAQNEVPEPAAHPQPQPLTLDDCVRIGLARQPTLNAARATLAAAETQRQALQNLHLASLVSRELPIRRQQATLGVTIASAGVQQAEWETVYAVTRNYFSVAYARAQESLVTRVLEKLKTNLEFASALLKVKGAKINKIAVDKLDIQIQLYQVRQREAQRGVELARAALREAMGLAPDCPLELIVLPLSEPTDGALDLHALVQAALTRRGELVQATTAARVTELEVEAQDTNKFALTFRTFAAVSDIHSREIPQGHTNREYRPGAIGLEMPTTLAGRRSDRVQRARDLSARAASVVEKTTNLIALETEAEFLKWKEAVQNARSLKRTATQAEEVADLSDRQANLRNEYSEDVLRARTLHEQVQSQYNQALYLHALALAGLERVTAGGFCPPFRAPPPQP
ncbi:MAG: TolC family protein [Gemmataceae bacterium]|nr:TolC family protein [Gemmataceae bacterium]